MKSENESIHFKEESAHKLRKIIENLKKQNKELEEQNNDLIKRLEVKEKTRKINEILLSKEKIFHKFDNLHKINIESFIFKRKKNEKDKFIISNNVRSITNRLYTKINKTESSINNKKKIIIIKKENHQLNNKNISSLKKKKK